MDTETYIVCPYCREVIDPTDPSATYAVPLTRARTFGGTGWTEGIGGYFHPGCSPAALGWRTKPRPT